MQVSDILRAKGDRVVTVPADVDIARLLVVLAEHQIGAVVVSDDGGSVQGIVSERDVVRALAQRGPAVLAEPVRAVCTPDVHTVGSDVSLDDVMRLMTDYRIRHLPVVRDGRLTGIVSIGDVVKYRIDELETERTALSHYIAGDR
jgi:CBS domain-containing protein